MTDAALTPFTMIGDAAVPVCDGDVCLIPGVSDSSAENQSA